MILSATSAASSMLVQAEQHDDEFVAAHARHGVAVAHAGDQALGHVLQHAVAGGVAERVVDFLEVVEVDEQHRHLRVQALAVRGRLAHAVDQQQAVGQAGQRRRGRTGAARRLPSPCAR